jgi:hypothetical protein
LDNRWFKEDRKLPKNEQAGAKAESEKALKNSTLFQRRLDGILDDLIEASHRDDEDFTKPNWQLEAVSGVSRRKALREIKRLIQLT